MNTSNAQISLQHVHLKLTTTAWNEGHDRLSTVFLRRRNARLKRVVQGLYDIGTFLAVLGMCGCVAGLCWLVFAGLEDALGPKKSSPGISVAQTVHKREVLEGTKAGGRTGSGVVTLIVRTLPSTDPFVYKGTEQKSMFWLALFAHPDPGCDRSTIRSSDDSCKCVLFTSCT